MISKDSTKYYFKIFILIITVLTLITSEADAKRKKRRRVRYIRPVTITIKKVNELEKKVIADGIIYRNLEMGNGKRYFGVNVAELDMTNPKVSIFVYKMGNNANVLENLPVFVQNYNSTCLDSIFVAVNANFWKAYSNSPIGPTIINGEVIEIAQFRKWSSLLFDSNNVPYINNYNITGTIRTPKTTFKIDFVNRRKDSTGISFYNSYAGNIIPFVQKKKINQALDSAFAEWSKEKKFMTEDSTEQIFDTTAFIESFTNQERENKVEQKLNKYLLKYLDKPSVNGNIRVVVIKQKTGELELPANHCIVSFGNEIPADYLPSKGDTLILKFSTNVDEDIIFKNGVCGTPRISRNGIAKQEAKEEGNVAKRFINSQLPRTMIGYNKDKTKFYLITVRGTASSIGQYGANLNDLAKIAKELKIYDAINLDGGGSSTFVLNGMNIMRKSDPSGSRKLSMIIGFKKK